MSRCSTSRGRSKCSRARGRSRAPTRAGPTTARRSRPSPSRARATPITAIGGLMVTPRYSWADAPPIDILVVPGGFGTRALLNDEADARVDPRDRGARASGDVGLHRRAAAGEARPAAAASARPRTGRGSICWRRSIRPSRCSAIAASSTTASSRQPASPPASTCRSPSSSRSAAARSRWKRLTTSNIHGDRHDVPKHQNAV